MTTQTGAAALSLVVRRLIHASAERLFAAWTQPDQLQRWWGPEGVSCVGAELDLRVGGAYRIANRLSDGHIVHICGAFEQITPPRLLVFSWRVEPGGGDERVTVRFEPRGAATEIVVIHERIADHARRDRHEAGWDGCLDGLATHVACGRL